MINKNEKQEKDIKVKKMALEEVLKNMVNAIGEMANHIKKLSEENKILNNRLINVEKVVVYKNEMGYIG